MVGITGFEPATSRPPDVHSNRTELYPDAQGQRYDFPAGRKEITFLSTMQAISDANLRC